MIYSELHASVVEWSITTDCKSVAFGLRRFESYPTHKIKRTKQKLGSFNLYLVGESKFICFREGREIPSHPILFLLQTIFVCDSSLLFMRFLKKKQGLTF
jgi:hypothetical protein